MPLFTADNLSFLANAATPVSVLDRLSLTVGQGEIHALFGANGSGKSTLAYLIMGCGGYRPTSGDLIFDGSSLLSVPMYERARRGISLAWQEPARFEGITVHDYLALGQGTRDPGELLELVGLSPAAYADRFVDRTLSGGERKRIELASVLALRPRLAILDEPDSGIDMLSIDDIVKVIQSFRTVGAAVLLITHRLELSRIADRASQLCCGRIVCTGTPDEVAQHYQRSRCDACAGTECRHE